MATDNQYTTDSNTNINNSNGCPKCHSDKVKFQREKIASYRNSVSGKTIITDARIGGSVRENEYRTIGICQNCGYTWEPNKTTKDTPKKNGKGCLWWLLMVLIWPISLSIWFYKTEKVNLDKKIRIAIIVGFWAICIIASPDNSETEPTIDDSTRIESTVENNEVSEETTENVKLHFNEEFINNYLHLGVPTIIEEYNKLEENGEYDKARKLLYRNHQSDDSIPVLEEQMITGKALVISTNEYYSDKGTTMAELYLGEYEFNYNNGLIPETEKLLAAHPEEWNKFVTVVSDDYMKIKKGDYVTFEGTIYGIEDDSMSIRGTCYTE